MKTKTLILAFLLSLTTSMYAQKDCTVVPKKLIGEYTGDCKKGKAHGQGVAKGEDTYKGEFKKGLPHGKGEYYFGDSAVFIGTFRKGERDGFGKFISLTSNDTLSGIWSAGNFLRKQLHEVMFEVGKTQNVGSHSVQRVGDGADITVDFVIKATAAGEATGFMVDLSSGRHTRPRANRLLIEDIVFPLDVYITYKTPSVMATSQNDCIFSVKIYEPGKYTIRLSH